MSDSAADVLPPCLGKRYQNLERIGEGGMGTTYRACDTKLERTVALKVIRRDLAAKPELGERFEAEVRSLSRLSHPNVVRLFEFHDDDGGLLFTMEYVEGRTLSDLVEETPLKPLAAVELAASLAAALTCIHEAGLLHRDIKPQNVMVTGEGVAKLVDFGVAKDVSDPTSRNLTRTGQLVGSLHYLPPEVFAGQAYDGRGDVYQLGLCLYVALTGRHPFEGAAIADLAGSTQALTVPPPSARAASIGPELDALVLRAMCPDTSDRFQTAQEVEDACRAWLQGEFVAPSAPKHRVPLRPANGEKTLAPGKHVARTTEAPSRPSTTRSWWVGGALVLLVAVGLLLMAGTGSDTPDWTEKARGFLRAAKAGNAEAQYQLGRCYLDGRGVRKDYDLAARWMGKALHQGHGGAMYQMALMMEEGLGMDRPNLENTVFWLRKAAAAGHVEATRELGSCLLEGRGVEKDREKALSWLAQAADAGDEKARRLLKAEQR